MELGKYIFEGQYSDNAPDEDVKLVETLYGSKLPIDYLEVLKSLDGFSGEVKKASDSESYAFVSFIHAGDVVSANHQFPMVEFEPKLMLVGSDGAGTGLFLERHEEGCSLKPWVALPFIGLTDGDPNWRVNYSFATLNDLLDLMVQ